MDRSAWVLRQFERKRARLGADTCQVIQITEVSDGFGGSTQTETVLATEHCYFQELTEEDAQQVVSGGVITVKSHRITLPATAITRAIVPDYKIKALARGDHPEVLFEEPSVMEGSFNPLVKVAARVKKT